MPNTTILFLLCFFAALAASIMHPIWALVAYLVDYYQHPPLRWWGRWLPSSMRWALLASIVLLVTNLMHGKMPLANNTVRHKQVKCLLLFCVIAALVTPNAVAVDRSIHYLTILLQLTLLVLVMINTVDRMPYWRLVIVLMAIGGFTWGLDAWIDPERVAGRLQAIGGPDSRDDNSAALHLLASLPFIAVLMFHGRKYERVIGLLAFPFIVNTIILCNSRGATVAMVAMGLSGVVLASGTLRLKLAAVVVAGGLATAVLADPQFVERQLTIVSGEQDGSTRGRIEAWKGAMDLMWDYPLGAGGGGFDALSPVYIPEVVARYDGAERAVHNTYLSVGADWGMAGLLAFLGYLWFTFSSVQRVRRDPSLDRRTALEGLALQTSLVGVCVGAVFINRGYAEILYWLPALGTAYVNLVNETRGQIATASAGDRTARNAPPFAREGSPAFTNQSTRFD